MQRGSISFPHLWNNPIIRGSFRSASDNNKVSRHHSKHRRHHSKHHDQHKHHHKSMKLESALFQIKWKRLDDHGHDDDHNANHDHHHHHRYHTTTLEGSIDLLRSEEDPTDFMLHFDPQEGAPLNIPLPAGVDWNVTCEKEDIKEDDDHDDILLHAEVVRLCYVTPDTHCKVKILIGLAFDNTDHGSCHKAKRFSEAIVMANLQANNLCDFL